MYDVNNTVLRIKQRAKELNIKTADMIKELGLARNTLYSMSGRGSWIQANSLGMIADYLKCSVDYLLGRTDITDMAQSGSQSSVCQTNDVTSSVEEKSQDSDDISEIASMYKQLSLVDKAQIVVMMHKMLERKS